MTTDDTTTPESPEVEGRDPDSDPDPDPGTSAGTDATTDATAEAADAAPTTGGDTGGATAARQSGPTGTPDHSGVGARVVRVSIPLTATRALASALDARLSVYRSHLTDERIRPTGATAALAAEAGLSSVVESALAAWHAGQMAGRPPDADVEVAAIVRDSPRVLQALRAELWAVVAAEESGVDAGGVADALGAAPEEGEYGPVADLIEAAAVAAERGYLKGHDALGDPDLVGFGTVAGDPDSDRGGGVGGDAAAAGPATGGGGGAE